MYDYIELWRLVLKEFLSGSSQEEAFQSICHKRRMDPPNNKTIAEFMADFFEEERSYADELRCTIIGQYLKFKNAIFFQDKWECNFHVLLNDRFIFSISRNLNSFSMTDSFNNETRPLRCTWAIPECLYMNMVQVGYDQVLASVACGTMNNNTFKHFLLKINFKKRRVSVTSFFELGDWYHMVVPDSLNFGELALFDSVGNESYSFMYKARVSNDRLILDKRRIEFNDELYFCKLVGGNVLGFHAVNDVRGDWQFCEYSLGVNSNYSFKVHSAGTSNYFSPYSAREYVWSKDKLYICDRKFDLAEFFMISVFDAKTHTWHPTKCAGTSSENQLSIDEDEVLTVGGSEYSHHGNYKTIYRFPMKKPDKLSYLAWFTIRRGATFFKSDLYDRYLPHLPFNSKFRVFSKYY